MGRLGFHGSPRPFCRQPQPHTSPNVKPTKFMLRGVPGSEVRSSIHFGGFQWLVCGATPGSNLPSAEPTTNSPEGRVRERLGLNHRC